MRWTGPISGRRQILMGKLAKHICSLPDPYICKLNSKQHPGQDTLACDAPTSPTHDHIQRQLVVSPTQLEGRNLLRLRPFRDRDSQSQPYMAETDKVRASLSQSGDVFIPAVTIDPHFAHQLPVAQMPPKRKTLVKTRGRFRLAQSCLVMHFDRVEGVFTQHLRFLLLGRQPSRERHG